MGNIFIYGGCVTRDAFEHLEGHNIVEYVARQSLISANSPATALLVAGQLASAFQDRSLSGDIKSSLFGRIRASAAETDLFLMDLLSERLGVLPLPDGSYVTDSSELRRSGRLGRLRPERLTFGTDQHFRLWKLAAAKFSRVLTSCSIIDKVLVVETPWAEVTDDGKQVPRFRGIPAADANTAYLRYYVHLRELGFRSVRIPDNLAVSSQEHKWGPDPYHYSDPAYHWIRDQINTAI